MSVFRCAVCERQCEASEHGCHNHADGMVCDDCHFGDEDEQDADTLEVSLESPGALSNLPHDA